VAAGAEKVVEAAMRVEPMIATGVSMFVPGAAPIVAAVQPWVVFAAPYLERALTAVSTSNGGDALAAVIEVLQHITPGSPNSPALSPPVPNTASASAQGSG
jgi:hypothetical protein